MILLKRLYNWLFPDTYGPLVEATKRIQKAARRQNQIAKEHLKRTKEMHRKIRALRYPQ